MKICNILIYFTNFSSSLAGPAKHAQSVGQLRVSCGPHVCEAGVTARLPTSDSAFTAGWIRVVYAGAPVT